MKNQNLYTHLFNLRQVLHTMMGYENCWSLHYAMKLNMISHLNSFMDQLHEKDNLIPIPLVLEIDTVTKKPTLKELVDLKNQILNIYGKGKKQRQTPISKTASEWLSKYLNHPERPRIEKIPKRFS